jgi:hypothetical protein
MRFPILMMQFPGPTDTLGAHRSVHTSTLAGWPSCGGNRKAARLCERLSAAMAACAASGRHCLALLSLRLRWFSTTLQVSIRLQKMIVRGTACLAIQASRASNFRCKAPSGEKSSPPEQSTSSSVTPAAPKIHPQAHEKPRVSPSEVSHHMAVKALQTCTVLTASKRSKSGPQSLHWKSNLHL